MEGGIAAAFAAAFLSMMLILLVPILLASVAIYVINGISLMTISKKLGVARGWLAFIPFADYWLQGKLAEEDQKAYYPEKKAVKWSMIYLVGATVAAVLSGVLSGIQSGVTSVLSFNESEGATTIVMIVGLLFYFFSSILSLATTALLAVVLYKIYHRMAAKSAIWMTLLSVFVPLAQPVILAVLAFSKKYPVAVPVKGPAEPLEVSAQDATAEPFGAQDEPLEHPEATEQQETANGAE